MSSFSITKADAEALGLTPPTGMGTDGDVGFNSSDAFSFNPASTPAGRYGFLTLTKHEISEVIGQQERPVIQQADLRNAV